MFEQLKKLFIGNVHSEKPVEKVESPSEEKKLQVATCAIFLEMAKIDDDFTKEEMNEIIEIMQKTFMIDKEYVKELIDVAESKLEKSVSMYEFTGIVNEHFSSDQKFELMKNLWRLIYTDKKLDKYEDQLVKTLGTTLLLEHKDIIAAKLMVKEEMG